jgi:hypothetical protein
MGDGDDDFAAESTDPAAPREGPPEDWQKFSWFDFKAGEWWHRFPTTGGAFVWRRDPPPVVPLGFVSGEYIFVTKARELRHFTAGQLHGRGGLADLFAGDLRWPIRHYPATDREGAPTGRPSVPSLMEAMIRFCVDHARYYDGAIPHRSIGTWREDGLPLVHSGDRIFHAGTIHAPGEAIGEARYVLGANRQAPLYVNVGRDQYEWRPGGLDACARVLGHLEEWHWANPEALELFAGWLWCALLGDAPRWKPHMFVRAVAGSGKSTLLKFVAWLLGGAAHPVQRTFSKARLEERFAHTACALLLEEAEGDPGREAERMKQVLDLLLLLSDDGAVGGRYKREIDLHGLACLVATLTDEWRTTIKSRVTLLELKPLRARDRALLSAEALEALMKQAAEISPGLRARAIARYDLFQENLVLIRARILELGGSPRDADQLGHLLAGWACMSWDEAISEDELGRLDRFRDYILTVRDEEEGLDDASECFNILLGLPAQSWRGGDQLTIGQLIARAREPLNDDFRRTLLGYGLRLHKLPAESWAQAWLAIANKHPGLDRLFGDYPNYKGQRRTQILAGLRRVTDGQEHMAKPSEAPLRFAGPQSRALLVPPELLPSKAEEDQPGPRTPEDIPT